MPSTRTLVLLSMAVLMGCATEKSATEKPQTGHRAGLRPDDRLDEVPPCPCGGSGRAGNGERDPRPGRVLDHRNGDLLRPLRSGRRPRTSMPGKPASPDRSSFPSAATWPLRLTRPSPPRTTSPPPAPRRTSPSFVQSLKSGGAYVNVHTAACKPGRSAGKSPDRFVHDARCDPFSARPAVRTDARDALRGAPRRSPLRRGHRRLRPRPRGDERNDDGQCRPQGEWEDLCNARPWRFWS